MDDRRHLALERAEFILRTLGAVVHGLTHPLEQRAELTGLWHEERNTLVHRLRHDLIAVQCRHHDGLHL